MNTLLTRIWPQASILQALWPTLPSPQKPSNNKDSKPLDPSLYLYLSILFYLIYLSTLDSMVYYDYYLIISLNYIVPLPANHTFLGNPQVWIKHNISSPTSNWHKKQPSNSQQFSRKLNLFFIFFPPPPQPLWSFIYPITLSLTS